MNSLGHFFHTDLLMNLLIVKNKLTFFIYIYSWKISSSKQQTIQTNITNELYDFIYIGNK